MEGAVQEGAASVFGSGPVASETAPVVDLKLLHAKIGGADAGEEFFTRHAQQGRPAERQTMDYRGYDLPVVKQAGLLRFSEIDSILNR